MPFDHAICATLHNSIVRIGWEATGRSFDDAPFQPYWTAHSDEVDRLRTILTTETIEFYQKALVHNDQPNLDDPYQNFFYFCSDLADPMAEANWTAVESLNDGQGTRFIVLYSLSDLDGGHRVGIVLDQQAGKAIMQPDLFSADLTMPGLPWQPLEDILRSFVDMINVRKVVAGNFKSDNAVRPFGMAAPQYPCKMQSYSDEILNMTLEAYQGLLNAIQSRMPSRTEDGEPQALAMKDELDHGELPKTCFARSFLMQARRPRRKSLRFIAPGISLPSPKSLSVQPFKTLARENRHTSPNYGMRIPDEEDPLFQPILMFPAVHNGVPGGANTSADSTGEPVFDHPFNSLSSVPAGLYLDSCCPWSSTAYEDASLLLLPYTIGGPAGLAQYNDQTPFAQASSCDLYQAKVNPFTLGHRTQLHLIFDSWKNMVVSGRWYVDEEGVAGSIDKFREADRSNELASMYTAALHW